jgi:hypothetical protein
MREDVVAALEAHFAAGRPPQSRLFRETLDRLGLYESNITQIAFDRQDELRERWRAKAEELGRDPYAPSMDEDTRAMIWIDGLLSALALVEQGLLP